MTPQKKPEDPKKEDNTYNIDWCRNRRWKKCKWYYVCACVQKRQHFQAKTTKPKWSGGRNLCVHICAEKTTFLGKDY